MDTKKFITRNSITIKALVVGILILLMLIPISMVKSLVNERDSNRILAQEDITSKWGGRQTIVGPVLMIPYKSDSTKEATKYIYLLPDEYLVDGIMKPEQRSRGIYDILCYQADVNISGKFNSPDLTKLNIENSGIEWKDARLIIGIPYLQGIKNKINFSVNGQPQKIISSVMGNDIIATGITVKFPMDENNNSETLSFDFFLSLNGSDGLFFAPIGKQTSVNLRSTYSSPKFTGDFLPNSRKLDKNGFDVRWEIFDYNRNYAQTWVGQNTEISSSKFGVDLLVPINEYQKNIRSIKYAILFIALTFVVFFIIELTNKKPIHPVQYLLVSFALVLFYSLLLAFSEYIGFNWAYLISAMAIITLLSAYSHSIFKSLKRTGFMCVFLSALYAFLYIIIQEEEKSLLFGNIGLFVVLAIIMYASRKINWYKDDSKTINAE